MKFRRNKTEPQVEREESPTGADVEPAETESGPRSEGPWDISEVTVDEDDRSKVDLGSLIVTGRPDIELRLQVDEATKQVAAVLLVGEAGAVELRPFAASRNEDLWDQIRPQIAAETSRRGGTATEADSVYGTELRLVMPVTTPDGKPASQPSRVFGIGGPRWMLRATLLGQPAVEPDYEGAVESAMRDVVVVRGSEPMAPGDPLPIVMPAGAEPAESP